MDAAACKCLSVSLLLPFLSGCAGPPPPVGPPPQEVLAAVMDGRATPDHLLAWEALLDDRAPHAGPQHEEIWLGRSEDGFRIDLDKPRLLRRRAAVPEVVTAPDGRTFLFHVEGDLDRARALALARDPWMRAHGIIGFGAIDLMIGSPSSGFLPEPRFVVHDLTPGMIVDPTVRPLAEGRWRMYYVGLPVSELLAKDAWADGADHTVFTAVSSDLIEWKQEGEAVRGPNADPAVWCDGDWCVMISTGLDRSVSVDGGRTFTFDGDFGTPGFAPAFLDLPDGSVRLFYNTKDRGGALRSMLSTDRGRTFRKEPGNRVPSYTLEAPAFQADPAGGWWVYYHYWVEGMSPNQFENGFLNREAKGASPSP